MHEKIVRLSDLGNLKILNWKAFGENSTTLAISPHPLVSGAP
jgi:hypothetical protein